MGLDLRIESPKGKVVTYKTKKGVVRAKTVWNKNYFQHFNSNLEKIGAYQDKRFAENLMKYVSFKTGAQEQSIPIKSIYGSGKITIGVPYAAFQAYSKKITKRKGKRGTYPFERMVKDKKITILREVVAYARRLNG